MIVIIIFTDSVRSVWDERKHSCTDILTNHFGCICDCDFKCNIQLRAIVLISNVWEFHRRIFTIPVLLIETIERVPMVFMFCWSLGTQLDYITYVIYMSFGRFVAKYRAKPVKEHDRRNNNNNCKKIAHTFSTLPKTFFRTIGFDLIKVAVCGCVCGQHSRGQSRSNIQHCTNRAQKTNMTIACMCACICEWSERRLDSR